MSGEQQKPAAESGPAFGEILINPEGGNRKKKEKKSVPPPKPKKQRAQRKQRSQKKTKKEKTGSRKKLLWCSLILVLLPVLLFLSYLAAATYFLPSYIQNQLTAQYGQQLNRPVTIDQATFSPFSFDLHLGDIYIGPKLDRQGANEPALCRIATLDTRVRPAALLQGKILLEESQIQGLQAEVVRRADGSFTDFGLAGQDKSLLPHWLQVDGFSLTDSMLVLRDTSTGHEYRLDEIAFSLPSAEALVAINKHNAATPTLHALVNGNPVQIRGERQISPDKGPMTRLTLQLDDVNPQQVLAWLPSINDGLRITSENTTASLELILPDNPQDEEELALSGTISFTGLNVESSLKKEGVDQKGVFQCTAPSAKFILQANPFRRQYKVVELALESPQLFFPKSKKKETPLPFSNWSGQLLDPALLPVDLKVDQLSINNGTLHTGKEQIWDKLQLELTDYQNRALSEKNQENSSAALSFSAQQGASTIRFQGSTTPHLDLIGKISLQKLDVNQLQPYLNKNQEKKQAIQLTAGKADLIMQVNPVTKQYIINELTLEEPQLSLTSAGQKAISTPSSGQLPFSIHPGWLLQPDSLPFELSIDRFIINKGRLEKKQGPAWQELHINLTDYKNRKPASSQKNQQKESSLSLTARNGKNTVRFQGSVAADLSLNGKIFLGKLSSDQLQPYLGSQHGLRISGGRAEVHGLLQTGQARGKKHALIKEAKITLHDLVLHKKQQKKPLLIAGSATAEKCTLNITVKNLSCADLLLQQADFSQAAPAFFLTPEKPASFSALSFNTIKIKKSKARLPLGSSTGSSTNRLVLPLTEMNMSIKDLQAAPSEQANFRLQAKINPHTKVTAEGPFHQGNGNLNLTIDNLDISLLNKPFAGLFQKKLAPNLKQGQLFFQGQFRIPELDFQGNVQLKNLVAENPQGVSLRWKTSTGSEMLGGMHPFFLHIKELVVQEPELQLSSSKTGLPEALLSLLRQQENKPVLPPFTIKQCRIQNGSLPNASQGRSFTTVQGQLSPLASGTPASFTFSGTVNKREFSARGKLQQNGAEIENFTVAELPLGDMVQYFAEQFSLKEEGIIRWIPSTEQQDQGQVRFSGFLPQQGSDYTLLLGLLTDNNGAFSFPLSLPATASPKEISQKAKARLQRLHLQTVVSPHAVLEKEFPDLALPQRINFVVGDSLPDFMDDLENFAVLLERRPFLRIQLRGCYDDTADRKYLLRLLQEEEDYRIDLENIRRQEEMARLLAEEELRQVELLNTDSPIGEDLIPVIEAREDLQPLPHQPVILPQEILPELARQRARVVQEYLVDTLKLPAERVTMGMPGTAGPWVDLLIEAHWQQPAETHQISTEKEKE
jgi:flagellar basal body-associated protein FliL